MEGLHVHLGIKAEPYRRKQASVFEDARNKALVKSLSKSFRVAKSDIIFRSGQQSKIKSITFPLTEKFNEWIKQNGDR